MKNRQIAIKSTNSESRSRIIKYLKTLGGEIDTYFLRLDGYIYINSDGKIIYDYALPYGYQEIYLPKIVLEADGTKERGKAIIKYLESLGGKNISAFLGNDKSGYYFINSIDNICADTSLPYGYTLIDLPENNTENKDIIMKNKILTAQNAKRIFELACSLWKERLAELWGKQILLGQGIEISEEFYKEMRKACTTVQHSLFDEIFGSDVVHPEQGTPCFVTMNSSDAWCFRYADGNGRFFNDGNESGKSTHWNCYVVIDVNSELNKNFLKSK